MDGRKKNSFPPISLQAKISWTNRKFHGLYSFLEKIALGFTFNEDGLKAGLTLGALSSFFQFLSEDNIYDACKNWEGVGDLFINSMVHDHVYSKHDLIFGNENGFQTYFRKLEDGVWVASRNGEDSWWYPDFETGIKVFLKQENYWRILRKESVRKWYYAIEKDTNLKLETSDFLTQLIEEYKPYLENGESRCILFTGPPGTGKSSIIYQLAKNLTKGYIRVPFKAAISHNFWEIAKIGKFPAIIIDDIDHGETSNALLENLEHVRKTTPLILMSSNSTKALKGAILRPGRVDAIHEILSPDPKLIKKLTTNIPEKYLPDLEGLYISYLVELDTRCKLAGTDKIETWILEMHDRVSQVGDGWDSTEKDPSKKGDN